MAEAESIHPGITTVKNGKITAKKPIEKLSLICLDDVEEENVSFLYEPYIPKGKVTLIGAYPGVGKTYMMCKLAACVSTGSTWMSCPKESPFTEKAGKVIYLTAEDGIGDTIKTRLRVCGADMKNVYTLPEGINLTLDDPDIERFVKEKCAELLVIDPLQAYIGKDTNMNAANETREKLNPMIKLAKEYNVAIVIVCHFNKNMKGDAITRILGSTDIVGVCRSYLALGNVPDEVDIKYMSHEKSSLAKKGKTILFEIAPNHGGIRVIGQTDLTADDYTTMANKNKKRSSPVLEEAKEFIIRNIPNGERGAKEMMDLMKANGFSERTIKRAKASAGVISKKKGYKNEWYWMLPRQDS